MGDPLGPEALVQPGAGINHADANQQAIEKLHFEGGHGYTTARLWSIKRRCSHGQSASRTKQC
ncbi:hypothetical protein ACTG9Q_28815 [Actinokineospora sp. 24-640]